MRPLGSVRGAAREGRPYRDKNFLHGRFCRTAKPFSSSVQKFEESYKAFSPVIVHRVAHKVPPGVRLDLGGHEQQFQAGKAVGVAWQAQPLAGIPGFSGIEGRILAGSRQQLCPSPQVVGEHHDLEENVVGVEIVRRDRQHAFPLRFTN